ncbi:hypothetical protein IU453_26920 [Nocardia cyriacigeorgica]|uniref:hypothetical protein n=1 Tax=Nocardia cyriacigeorgica TaxID=135487 RepID=UPI0018958EF2|nr:hypothetical protein [Nocardia cyriacigeorgica]MBF6320388.1 hypothetical protein [Nocardia cyriacigeorgica]MBF6534126.1 hypothetical protein [Nocardia cyriacigeorgica]
MKTPALLVPATLLAAALTTSACTTDPPAGAGETTCAAVGFDPPFPEVEACSAEAVLVAATTAIFDYRPFEQRDQRAAFRSARPLMTREFTTRAEQAALAWAPITTSQWQHWATHATAFTTTVHVTGDDHPADTATSVQRVLAVELHPVGQARIAFAVYAHATRPADGQRWLLADLAVRS